MKQKHRFTVIMEREDNGYVSLCPELDIASQGDTIEQAKANLIEAVELFLEVASPSEIDHRLKNDIFITPLSLGLTQITLETGFLTWIERLKSRFFGRETRFLRKS